MKFTLSLLLALFMPRQLYGKGKHPVVNVAGCMEKAAPPEYSLCLNNAVMLVKAACFYA